MARYTDDSRERVRDTIDFVELVGARTELKQAGQRRMTGLCPFHEERTPSFGIDPVEKLYHCFGCGAGGDVFKFAMETEGLDFAAALEWLAERANLELEREAEDPREAERRGRRDRLLALLERTAAYYVRLLWESPDAAPAREYLTERGLEEGALREYRVGFAPRSWDRVITASRKAGFTDAELEATGLASHRKEGSGLLDRFRGRIMFPLADQKGHVLGFGARALFPDDRPKYLNTSESELFHKGRMVYGSDLARAAAAKAGRVVLAEGYTDVIALRQAGVPESVCSMGTALTDDQAHALRRLAPTVLFCQDPDTAGQAAVGKALSLGEMTRRGATGGLTFRVVRLPAGQGPGRRRPARRGGRDARAARARGPRLPLRGGAGARRCPAGLTRGARGGAAGRGAGDRAARAGAGPVRPHPARRQPAADLGEHDRGGTAARAAHERRRLRADGARRASRRASTGATTPSASSSPAA